MRIGLFLHETKPHFKLEEVIQFSGNEIVGYCSPIPLPIPQKKLLHFPNPTELAVCSDLLVFYSYHSYFTEIPEFALRRGSNIFFANLNECSLNFLLEINPIASEIGAQVGFGNSGHNLVDEFTDSTSLQEPLFSEVKRTLPTESNFSNFKEKIIYDLSSIIRTFPASIKRYKSLTLPVFTDNFKLLNLSIEFNNGSIVNYTADRLSSHSDFSKLLVAKNSATNNYSLSQGSKGSSSSNNNSFSPLDFICSAKNDSSPDFDICQAIQTLKLFEGATKQALLQV